MRLSLGWKSGTLRRWWHQIFYWWIKHYKLLFFFLFLIVLGIGGVQWFYHLERYAWTEEEKKSFIDRTVTETAFQEQKFRDGLSALEELGQDHQSPASVARDLFLGKKKKDQ